MGKLNRTCILGKVTSSKEGRSLFSCTTLSFAFREFIHSPILDQAGATSEARQHQMGGRGRGGTLFCLEKMERCVCASVCARATENKIGVIICDFTNCKQCPSWWHVYLIDTQDHTGSIA